MAGVEMALPGGVLVTVNEGTSREQAMFALKQASPKMYQMVREASAQEQGPPVDSVSFPIAGIGPEMSLSGLGSRAAVGIGRGMTDITQGAQQLTGMMNPEDEAAALEDVRQYEKLGGTGIDPWRITGQAAMTAPLGGVANIAKLPVLGSGAMTRFATGTAAGTAAGALPFVETSGERVQNMVGGGIGGGAFNVAAPAITSGVGKLFGAMQNVYRRFGIGGDAAQKITLEINDAANAIGVDLSSISAAMMERLEGEAARSLRETGEVNAQALLRIARGEKFGFVGDSGLTLGQSTRDPRQYSDEINLSKLDGAGDPLAGRFDTQRQQVDTSLRGIGSRQAGDDFEAAGKFEAGEVVEDAATAKAAKLQETVRAAYAAAGEAAPDVRIDATGFMERARPILQDFEDLIPKGVKRRIRELTDPTSGRSFTPDEAFKLDKLITDVTPSGFQAKKNQEAARRLQVAIADSMEEAGGDAGKAGALYKEAKRVASERFRQIGDPRGITARLIGSVLDPEKVVPQLKSGSVRQIRSLSAFLDDNPEAWRSIKAATLNDIIERSMPSGNFSQAIFNRQLKSMGPNRLEAVFGKEGAGELKEFGKVMEDLYSIPAGHRVNTSHTAPVGANLARRLFDAVISAAPGGRPALMMRDAGQAASDVSANLARATASLNPLPKPLPTMNLLAPVQPYASGLAPAAGLLSTQSLRSE